MREEFLNAVEEIYARDPRYKPDSYEFVMQALHFTQKKLKRQGHVAGRELLEGVRSFAVDEYGALAKTVLNHWGINATIDVGNIVFNMVQRAILAKTDADCLDDFKDAYSFDVFDDVLSEVIKKDLKT